MAWTCNLQLRHYHPRGRRRADEGAHQACFSHCFFDQWSLFLRKRKEWSERPERRVGCNDGASVQRGDCQRNAQATNSSRGAKVHQERQGYQRTNGCVGRRQTIYWHNAVHTFGQRCLEHRMPEVPCQRQMEQAANAQSRARHREVPGNLLAARRGQPNDHQRNPAHKRPCQRRQQWYQ